MPLPALVALLAGFSLSLLPAPPLKAQEAPRKGPEKPLHMGVEVPPGAVAVIDGGTISKERFIRQLLGTVGRPGQEGKDARKSLMDEAIVSQALAARHLEVTEDEIDAKVAWVERQLKESGKATGNLGDYLRQRGVSLGTFRRKLRSTVALEKLTRQDLRLPAGKPVKTELLNLWLLDHREKAVLETDQKKLDASLAFTANGFPVTKLRFARELLVSVAPGVVRKKVITPLLQEILARRLLKLNNLRLTQADIMAEWLRRKKMWESDPANEGIKFELIVKQQSGGSLEEFRNSPGFQIRAIINLLGRRVITEAQLKQGYDAYKGYYGPRLQARHILVRAGNSGQTRMKIRSFKEGKAIIDRILRELKSGQRWGDVARLYSEDLSTRYKGGRLPPFTPLGSHLAPALVKMALKLPIDTISNPIRSQYGWHILQVDKKDPPPPLAQVEAGLRRRLAKDLFLKAWAQARIGIDVRL